MANPILVTGAAGRVGAIGRTVTELLLKRGRAVRAMVQSEDERAHALRDMGAEIVVGNLLDLHSMHRAIAGCQTMYFGMSVSEAYLEATVNAAAVARHHGVKAFIKVRYTGRPCQADRASRRFLPDLHPGVGQGIKSDQTPVRRRQDVAGRVEDVARVIAALLDDPEPHIGKIYHLTGPQSENMSFYAQEYSKALGRTIAFEDIPLGPWRDALLERGLPAYLVNHLAAMADLHRAGRYDRMSNDVLTLTGQEPLSVREFVRNNAATFTASAKAA